MRELEHVTFSFNVELVTDCHIGNGEEVLLEELHPGFSLPVRESRKEQDRKPFASTIVRDFNGNPTIPATALKGALRSNRTEALSAEEIDYLFGSAKNKENGSMGYFSLYAGIWQEHPAYVSDTGGEQNNKKKNDEHGLPLQLRSTGSWISTHVAINRQTGAADHMKLFNMEMVPEGTVFSIEGIWFGKLNDAQEKLPLILAPLAQPEGLNIGSNQKHGMGAVRFAGMDNGKSGKVILGMRTSFCEKSGDVKIETVQKSIAINSEKKRISTIWLKLHCRGPYLSVDPTQTYENNKNIIKPLQRTDKIPVLHMQSLSGALRTRAAWLSECEGLGGDDPFRKPNWNNPGELTPVERLFGVSGWRGLLRLSRPQQISAESKVKLTSIALDRFSGAVLDSALFEHETHVDVRMDILLSLEERRDDKKGIFPTADDRKFFIRFLQEINGDVLTLGHATNRGFGWFDTTVTGLEAFENE